MKAPGESGPKPMGAHVRGPAAPRRQKGRLKLRSVLLKKKPLLHEPDPAYIANIPRVGMRGANPTRPAAAAADVWESEVSEVGVSAYGYIMRCVPRR